LYDLTLDRALIEASFAMQYGIRLRHEDDMTWGEFCGLLRGLTPETPLGRIAAIRGEKDPARIRTFSAREKKIRADWRRFTGREQTAKGMDWQQEITALQTVLAKAFL
jgi:hypothetical protein